MQSSCRPKMILILLGVLFVQSISSQSFSNSRASFFSASKPDEDLRPANSSRSRGNSADFLDDGTFPNQFSNGLARNRQFAQFNNPLLRTETSPFVNPLTSPQFGLTTQSQSALFDAPNRFQGAQGLSSLNSQFASQIGAGSFGDSLSPSLSPAFGSQFGSQFGVGSFGSQNGRGAAPNCLGYEPGLYGSPTYDCRVYYVCQPDGRLDPLQCSPGTKFNNALGICDWSQKVDANCNPLFPESFLGDRNNINRPFGASGIETFRSPSSETLRNPFGFSRNPYSSSPLEFYGARFQTPRYPPYYRSA